MKLSFRRNLSTTAVALLFGVGMVLTPAAVRAQNEAPMTSAAPTEKAAAPTWTTEQLITSTVHDAWVLSGRDEATFFEMVKTLAELSAKNRGITLPDTKAAGLQMGAYIKRTAKADTDQLLYAVVDKAVMVTAHKGPTPAGSRSAKKK